MIYFFPNINVEEFLYFCECNFFKRAVHEVEKIHDKRLWKEDINNFWKFQEFLFVKKYQQYRTVNGILLL